METKHYDIVIVGGSLGGVLAALSGAKAKQNVALIEETRWIGGQLTSQAVPTDEHRWIEEFGCTATYRWFRNRVRDHYRNLPNFKPAVSKNPYFNPGAGWVSRISHEPLVSLKILYEMLNPYIENGQLEIFLESIAVSAETENDYVKAVIVENTQTKEQTRFTGTFFIDGTDIGSLLPLTKTEYVTGAERPRQI